MAEGNTSPSPSVPSDLQAARDAVVKLVQCLDRAVKSFRGKGSDLAVGLPEGRELIPAVVDELQTAIADAEETVSPVRGQLTAASGKERSDHAEVIECAKKFAATAADLMGNTLDEMAIERWSAWVRSEQEWEFLRAGNTPGGNVMQRWLAAAQLRITDFLTGCTENLRADYTRRRGINFEMRRATSLREVSQVRTPSPEPQYVTLSEASGIAKQHKRTLERWRREGKLPEPDVVGTSGKPNKWRWESLRPALEHEIGHSLPNRFPSLTPTS